MSLNGSCSQDIIEGKGSRLLIKASSYRLELQEYKMALINKIEYIMHRRIRMLIEEEIILNLNTRIYSAVQR